MSSSPNSTPLRPLAFLLISLTAAWLLWSGIYKPHLLILGAVSVLLALWVAKRTGYFDKRLFALRFSVRLFGYWIWLGGQIIKSSIDVTRIVLHPKLPISPTLIELKSESAEAFDVVNLANSITLTPGTLSVDVDDNVIKVHALTRAGAEDLQQGDMNHRVKKVRG